MDTTTTAKSFHIIEKVAGCGMFQAGMVILVFVMGRFGLVFSLSSLSFAIYNPGWRCLDINETDSNGYNMTTFDTTTDFTGIATDAISPVTRDNGTAMQSEFIKDNCPLFKTCRNIQFHPDASTLISEWGLMCDKTWMIRLILSIQMIGSLIGAPLIGFLGDAFGRKPVLAASHCLLAVLNAACAFCHSWQLYAGLRFFMGIAASGVTALAFPFTVEFSTMKWRASLAAIPGWSVSAVLCALVVMLVKDWRIIHIITFALAIAGLLCLLWAPESLRWLEAKQKTDKFMKVANRITKTNGKTMPSPETLSNICNNHTDSPKDKKIYAMIDLFRPGYRIHTLALGLIMLTTSMWYYVILYGVGVLAGDFYTNNIISAASGIPLQIIPLLLPHLVGRKVSGFGFIGTTTLCFIIAAGFILSNETSLQTTGTRVLIMIALSACAGNYCVIMTQTSEIYPTVVRTIGQSWTSLVSRIGSTIAPFLVPTSSDSQHISFIIMGIFGILSCCAVFLLPETKGKRLKQTFNDKEIMIHSNVGLQGN